MSFADHYSNSSALYPTFLSVYINDLLQTFINIQVLLFSAPSSLQYFSNIPVGPLNHLPTHSFNLITGYTPSTNP